MHIQGSEIPKSCLSIQLPGFFGVAKGLSETVTARRETATARGGRAVERYGIMLLPLRCRGASRERRESAGERGHHGGEVFADDVELEVDAGAGTDGVEVGVLECVRDDGD